MATTQFSKDILLPINDKNIFKLVNSENSTISEYNSTHNIYITNNTFLSSNVNAVRSLQKDYASTAFPASSIFYYNGFFGPNATGSVTALYELVRGYLYRNDASPSVSSLSSIFNSKSTPNKAVTGFRMIIFDKSIKFDLIKPTSFRMAITPINITTTASEALYLSNTAINITDSSSGQYAIIRGQNSLSGSLSSGVSGQAVTGFTILIKAKPVQSGPTNQTFFHRVLGDVALSSINYEIAAPGYDNRLVFYHYGLLNPLSASIIGNPSFYQWNVPEAVYPAGAICSQVINITSFGGGQLNFSASARNNSSLSWLSLCSNLTSSAIYGIDNLTSTTASITAFVSSTAFVQGYPSGFYISYIDIFNSLTSLQKAPNLPISVQFTLFKS